MGKKIDDYIKLVLVAGILVIVIIAVIAYLFSSNKDATVLNFFLHLLMFFIGVYWKKI